MEPLDRRSFCRCALAGASGAFAGCSSSEAETGSRGDPLRIDLGQTDRMVEDATAAGKPASHALDVVEAGLELSLGDLIERSDRFGELTIDRRDEPVDTSRAYSTKQLVEHWKDVHGGDAVEFDVEGALLIDSIGGGPFRLDAAAELPQGGDYDRCEVTESATEGATHAALVTGEDLLAIDPGDVEPVGPAGLDHPDQPAYQTLTLATHEVGHTLCLTHKHGRIARADDGTLVVSPMVQGYLPEFAGEETACGERNAEVQLRTPEGETVEWGDNETAEFRELDDGPRLDEPARSSLRFSDCAVSGIPDGGLF